MKGAKVPFCFLGAGAQHCSGLETGLFGVSTAMVGILLGQSYQTP